MFSLLEDAGAAGWFVVLASAFGVAGGIGALRAGAKLGTASGARAAAIFCAALAALPVVIGVLGWIYDLSQVDHALQYVEPEYADEIRTRGREEAFACIQLGLLCASAPLLVALVGVMLAR